MLEAKSDKIVDPISGDSVCQTCGHTYPDKIEQKYGEGTRATAGGQLDHFPATFSDLVKRFRVAVGLGEAKATRPAFRDYVHDNTKLREICKTCNESHQFERIPGLFTASRMTMGAANDNAITDVTRRLPFLPQASIMSSSIDHNTRVILEHYRRQLGSPVSVMTVPGSCEVYAFENAIHDATLLLTLGLVNLVQSDGIAWELGMAVDAEKEGAALILAFVGYFLADERAPPARWIGGNPTAECHPPIRGLEQVDPDFVRKTGKSSVLFDPLVASPKGLRTFSGGRVWGVYPISEAEHVYLEKNGYEALGAVWEKNRVDLVHVKRKSAV